MVVHRQIDSLPEHDRACTVGTFDGVHLGHKELVGKARSFAERNELPSAVVTFEPHPLKVLRPEDAPKLITPLELKAELLESLHVDELIVVPFTRELASLSPETFCSEILADRIHARSIAVGENFRFGQRASGDVELLKAEGERLGFKVSLSKLVVVDGVAVSSSRIRDLIAQGEVDKAARCLGHTFQLEGKVTRGSGRGRDLGVPTANLALPEDALIPREGVYAAKAGTKPAAVNIGIRPTFEASHGLTVEAHIVDVDEDLYGKKLCLEFFERLRGEVRFDSEEELVSQMRSDIEKVREIARKK